MKTLTRLRTIAALFLLSVVSISTAKAQMNVMWADTLNKTLTQYQQASQMKGVASSVVFSDGSVWSSSAGQYGSTQLHSGLLYDIGSNTKTMIAALILLLEEEGKLSINDTLYHHIAPVALVPNGIALEQLLNHRSGIYNFTEHPDFFNEIFADESRFWHPDSSLARFLSPALFPAGSSFSYSNTNYMLLGKVIETIEQKPLNQVMKDRLFSPYQLNHSYLDQYDTFTEIKTGVWQPSGNYYGTDFVALMSSAWAAGAVVSTPEDLALWAHTLYRGDILSSNSMDKMRTGTSLQGGLIYGLGLFERTLNGKTYLGHGGNTLQNSAMDYSLASDFSVVVMNIDQGFYSETDALQDKLIKLVEALEIQVSIPEAAKNSYSVEAYPNPSNSQMVLNVASDVSNHTVHVEIRDVTGRLVKQELTSNGSIVLQKYEIGSGVFVANIFSDQQLIASKKVIFQ